MTAVFGYLTDEGDVNFGFVQMLIVELGEVQLERSFIFLNNAHYVVLDFLVEFFEGVFELGK